MLAAPSPLPREEPALPVTAPAKQALALAWILVALLAAGAVLWIQDGRYGQATPRPAGLEDAVIGAPLDWPDAIADHLRPGRPALLHFFNPDCPCSRFNLDHVRELRRRHTDDIDVVMVVESDATPGPGFQVPDLPVRHVHDVDGALADLAGVYATPVAVVLDREHRVTYVGNYTVTRYCNDPAGEPARVAIERTLGIAPSPTDATEAPVPYGCPLPSDEAEVDA